MARRGRRSAPGRGERLLLSPRLVAVDGARQRTRGDGCGRDGRGAPGLDVRAATEPPDLLRLRALHTRRSGGGGQCGGLGDSSLPRLARALRLDGGSDGHSPAAAQRVGGRRPLGGAVAMPMLEQTVKAAQCLRWLPAYAWQQILRRRPPRDQPVHLMIAVADHFEPSIRPEEVSSYASLDEQERRLERWCRTYPNAVDSFRDADGYPFRHTYFYPAEQAEKVLIDRLAEHCHAGWGEIEIHLHHGLDARDTAAGLRRVLCEFRDALDARRCLARWEDDRRPRYAFVHGNWALANSFAGRWCGVDEEMQILAETGCYADLTLPSAPNPAQVGKINALYECALPLTQRAPHRRGRDLRRGRSPRTFPLIVQGPLALSLARRTRGWPSPCIENGALTTRNPATMRRLRLWRRLAIAVRDRPEWLFIK